MKVQPVEQQNTTEFKARIKVKNPELSQVINISDKKYALDVLDRFESYKPDHVVEMSLTDKFIKAKNLHTGTTLSFTRTNASEDSKDFYSFLVKLLEDKSGLSLQFWGQPENARAEILPENHPVFIA